MNEQFEALRLADELYGLPADDFFEALGGAAAAELRRLHDVNAELVKAAADAERVIEILWVSHHASRADAVLEALRVAIAKAEAQS